MPRLSLRAYLLGVFVLLDLVFAVLLYSQYRAARRSFVAFLEREISGHLQWIRHEAASHPGLLENPVKADSLCRRITSFVGYRLTFIDSAGAVIADSHVPLERIGKVENHGGRPEVREARRSGWGRAERHSSTVGTEMLYIALDMGMRGAVVRMAVSYDTMESLQRGARKVFLLFLLAFVLVSGVTVSWASRKINQPLRKLIRLSEEDVEPARYEPMGRGSFSEAYLLDMAFARYVQRIKKLLEDLGRERNRLGLVLEMLDEGLVILDGEARVLIANPAALRLLGVSAEVPGAARLPGLAPPLAFAGQGFSDLTQHKPLLDLVTRGLEAGGPSTLTLEKGPFSPFDLLCHIRPLDMEGYERQYLLTLNNVTEFKNLDRAKTEFVANASHELKTPLSSIKGFAEALLDGALRDEKVREPFLRKIHANANRLERLIQNLLSLSQLEYNQVPTQMRPLNLAGMVHSSFNLLRPALEAAGLLAEARIPEGTRLFMEAKDLELILNNLIGNAVKYNRPKGRVTVRWKEDRGELEVEDTGIGIEEEILPHIFERFYRANSARGKLEGTGLGLAIVKHALHKYGMAVRVESRAGEGTRFIVEVPAACRVPRTAPVTSEKASPEDGAADA